LEPRRIQGKRSVEKQSGIVTPTPKEVYAHEARHGGLWLVIPAPTQEGQARPLFARLTVSVGISEPTHIWYEGGPLDATIAENASLQDAEWAPVDSKGNRL
jgi:hypothetical protein